VQIDIQQCIPEYLRYCVQYWTTHLVPGDEQAVASVLCLTGKLATLGSWPAVLRGG
jgi:hypothetical protein